MNSVRNFRLVRILLFLFCAYLLAVLVVWYFPLPVGHPYMVRQMEWQRIALYAHNKSSYEKGNIDRTFNGEVEKLIRRIDSSVSFLDIGRSSDELIRIVWTVRGSHLPEMQASLVSKDTKLILKVNGLNMSSIARPRNLDVMNLLDIIQELLITKYGKAESFPLDAVFIRIYPENSLPILHTCRTLYDTYNIIGLTTRWRFSEESSYSLAYRVLRSGRLIPFFLDLKNRRVKRLDGNGILVWELDVLWINMKHLHALQTMKLQ